MIDDRRERRPRRLRWWRVCAGLSQAALARRAGVASTTVWRIERGRSSGPLVRERLARALETTPATIYEFHTPRALGEPGADARPR